jgi:hypothetical protein
MNKLSLLLLLTAVPLVSAQSLAGHHGGCCANCGCHCPTRKVCRWEWEEKEVKEVVWKCECEDFCIPGPSPLCHAPQCEECADCCENCAGGHCDKPLGGFLHHKKKCGLPCSCKVRTKNILVRTEKIKKVKVPKCVIEDVCDRCCGNGACADCMPAGAVDPMASPEVGPPSDAPMPPMPPQATKQPQKKRLNPILTAFLPASR